jgi:hypothetical protein
MNAALLAFATLALSLAATGCSVPTPEPGPLGTAADAITLAGLFSTGVDNTGAPLAAGAVDPHYALSSSNDPNFPGPSAIVVNPAGGWTPNTATSKWISVQASTTGMGGGLYDYTTTFTVAGVNPATVTIAGHWSCDDECTLTLNGTQVATDPTPAWGKVVAFTVPAGSPFVGGTNTLVFATDNATGGPTGLQVVDISATGAAGCALDSDCTATQFCDTATAMCTPKLANGTPVPTIPGHAPPLTGACSSPVGAAVCTSGVCDTKDDDCGYANGDGPCTAGNGATVCRSGACSANGTCEPAGGCNVDADCAAGDWCDESTHTCTPTLANGQPVPTDPPHTSPTLNGTCTAAAGALVCTSGVCDTADGECGYANGDGPCTPANGGTVCRSGMCSTGGVCIAAGTCNTDADCANGNWCDESTHTCTPQLANGAPVPTDPPHTNPALNGTCTPAAGTLVCKSGVCDTKDDECGYANGDGPCTAGNGATVCRSGTCGPNGTCVASAGCTSDAQCSGAKPVCDTATSTCVQCSPAESAACTGMTPVCDAGSSTCVACNGDQGSGATDACPSTGNPFCFTSGPDKGECGTCTTNSDCQGHPGGSTCDTTTGACTSACTTDADCPSGDWCTAPTGGTGTCVPKLANGTPLPSTPSTVATCSASVGMRVCVSGVCDPKDNACGLANGDGTCTANAECRDMTCDTTTSTCGPPAGCTSDAGCPAGDYCGNGMCTPKKPTGAACTADDQCATDACAQKVCVNSVIGSGSGLLCAARPGGGARGEGGAALAFLLAALGVARRSRRSR